MKKMGSGIGKLLIFSFLLCCVGLSSTKAGVGFVYSENGFLSGDGWEEDRLAPNDTIVKNKKEKKKKERLEKRNTNPKKKITFETFERNYQRGMKFYQNDQYLSAARIFEELYPLSLGTPYADTILFTFAHCYYLNKDYEMAVFHYKDYTRRFPGTERTEEAHYMAVRSLYNLSPYYSLDQFETKYAIEEINSFIQIYPKSKYMEECNLMLDELRNKLAKKDFEILKLYYNTGQYPAVQISVKNFLKEYGYSLYAPEVMYILVKNNVEYAKKSIPSKQAERYQASLDAFESLNLNYPDSPFIEMAKPLVNEATKQLNRIKKRQ